jgi:putative aldouronate transport system substrate-binding protein
MGGDCKMKKIGKIMSLVIMLVMVFTLAACKPKGPVTTDPGKQISLEDIIPEETVTLTVYTQLANYSGEQIGWFAQVMLEKFNVKLNIINEGDGTFVTRMEAGDLGDIVVFGNDGDEYQQAVQAGLLFNWEEDDLLDDFGSYIKEHMARALDKNRNISNGKVYGFGHDVASDATEHQAFFYRPDIRWDLYQELGYPEVNTLEDFVDLLAEMQKLAPTSDTGGKTYGVSLFPDWDGNMVMSVKATGALYGYDEFHFGLYNVATQAFEDTLQRDGMYLRALKFYNKLYQRGLLNPDSMTQTYADMSEDYQTGAAFFNIFDWMASGTYNTPDHLAQGKAMLPLAAKDQKNIVYGLNVYGGNRVWTIGAKTTYPELSMAIINWLSTPEGKMTTSFGPKGLTWDYDAQGRPYLTELGESVMSNGDTQMSGGYSGSWTDGTSKINNTTWAGDVVNPDAKNGDTYNHNFWETRRERQVSEIEEDWRNQVGAIDVNDYLIKNGHRSIALGTTYSQTPMSDELRTIWNQVGETVKTYSWRAIYARTDAEYDAIVNEMIDKAFEYGYQECLDYSLAEVARRKALEDEVKRGN